MDSVGGEYLDRRIHEAVPDRAPCPRTEIRLMLCPIGGARSFEVSTGLFHGGWRYGGGACCGMPSGCQRSLSACRTSDVVAEPIDAAIKSCNLYPSVFGQVQGGKRAVGQAVVQFR